MVQIEKIFIGFKSELDWSVVEVHGLISGGGFGVVAWLTGIQVDVWGEKLDHVAQIHAHQESGDPEPEHGDSHGHVGDQRWGFVSQVEVFFVVDVIGSHLPDERVEGTSSSEGVVSFGLISSEMLGVVSGYVSVVGVLGCGPLESVKHLSSA